MKKFTLAMASAMVALSASAAPELVWEGNHDLGNWAEAFRVESAAFANAKAGDIITMLYDDVKSGAQYQVAFNDAADGDKFIKAVDYDNIVSKMASYTLTGKTVGGSTSTDVDMLKQGYFFTGGHDAVLVKVYFGDKYEAAKPSGTETIWEGSAALGTWDNDVEVGTPDAGTAGAWDNLFAGDKVIFNFSDCGAEPQIQINTKVGASWKWTTMLEAPIVSNKYEWVVADEMTAKDGSTVDLATIKARGVIIKGQDATLVSVVIDHGQGGGSAVENIAADENAPVEIYTLDGRRVNEMEKGLYIVRQGNKAVKVIK